METMKPLDDDELNLLLLKWTPPPVPLGLRPPKPARVSPGWWLRGTIRIPVPVGAAVLALLVYWSYTAFFPGSGAEPPRPPAVAGDALPPAPVAGEEKSSLSGFETVARVEPTVVGRVR